MHDSRQTKKERAALIRRCGCPNMAFGKARRAIARLSLKPLRRGRWARATCRRAFHHGRV